MSQFGSAGALKIVPMQEIPRADIDRGLHKGKCLLIMLSEEDVA